MKTEGQWIVMMGFLVSLGIFFLAIVISQSTLVGQTTAEGVLEFPKNDIQDLKHDILEVEYFNRTPMPYISGYGNSTDNISREIQQIALYRKSAIVSFTMPQCSGPTNSRDLSIHYNNGVTVYDEYEIRIYC